MAHPRPEPETIRLADQSARKPRHFRLEPGAAEMTALAGRLNLIGLKKLRLEGELRPEGRRDWALSATLGATVVQPCVVTLAPVTTRIDEPVERLYAADYEEPDSDEAEMPEDERIEPLPETLDLTALMEEALALALPLYPRAEGVELGEAVFTQPGAEPLTDQAARPFAGLKGLRDKLDEGGGEG